MKNIFNIKNRIFRSAAWLAVTLPLGGGMWSGCSDFLEVEPQNIITLEQFWNEEQDVTSSIAGLYTDMAGYNMLSRMMIWGEFRSENVLNRGIIVKDASLERVLKENITASNPYTDWSAFYNIINRCNIILHYAPTVSKNDPSYSPDEMEAHKAEVIAIRSLCYFYLIRTFRDVPYTEEAYLDDAQRMNLPAEKFDVILDHLISSLEAVKNNAIEYYPKVSGLGAYYQTSRITKLTIQALLCELYLWKGDYDRCISYADQVIEFKKKYVKEINTIPVDYSKVNGYPLTSASRTGMSSFGYAHEEIFVDNASPETIFELAFVKKNDNMPCNGPVSNFYGANNFTSWVIPSEFLQSGAKKASTAIYVNDKDGRRYENFRFNTGGEVLGISKYTLETCYRLPSPTVSNFFNYLFGIQYPVYGKDEESRNKSNWIIYRLPDIMLFKAEALTLKVQANEGTLSDQDKEYLRGAFELCNAVNKRSIYQETLKDTLVYDNYSTRDKMLDLVYDERERELMFEGKRFFDLVRRSMREGNTTYLRKCVSRKSSDLSSIIDNLMTRMDAIFWPYNLQEIKVNDQLHQNPAFGSGENSSFEKN